MAYYQQHMLSIKARNTLANILAQYTLINQTNESYRQAIANSPYFDSLALFRLIDHNEKGYISQKDLQKVIGTKHRKLLTYAFTWIDALKTGQVTRLEFATFLLPRDDLQLRELIAERIEHPEIEYCSKDAVFQQFSIFRQMILQIIRREMKLIELRRQLLSQPDYSVHGSLLAIDNNRHDWVCAQDIEKFMQNYGYHITLRQVEKLVEVMNSSMDGKVSQQQLKWVIEGLQGSDRQYLNRIKQVNRSSPPQRPANIQEKFMDYRSRSKAKQTKQSSEQQKYNNLISQLRSVQLQQQKAEQSLLLKQRVTIQSMKDMVQQQRLQLQAKKKLELEQRQKQRLILQAKYKMEQEMHQLMHKTNIIQAQTQRLARIDNRVNIHNDLLHIKYQHNQQIPYHHPQKLVYLNRYRQRENRPPSFGIAQYSPGLLQESSLLLPKTYKQEYINHVYQTNYNTSLYPEYTLDNNNYITSNRLSQSIQHHLQNSDLYLQSTRKIKQKIRAERQAERQIRNKLTHKQYQHTPIATHHKQPGTIQQSRHQPIKPQHNNLQLGLESGQKGSLIAAKWESPQQRVVRQSVLQKLDQSTTNKPQTAK